MIENVLSTTELHIPNRSQFVLCWHKSGSYRGVKDKIKAFCLLKGFNIPDNDDDLNELLNSSPIKFSFSTYTTVTEEELEWALSITASVIWENCALIDYEKLKNNREYLYEKIGGAIRCRYQIWEERKNFEKRFGFKRPW